MRSPGPQSELYTEPTGKGEEVYCLLASYRFQSPVWRFTTLVLFGVYGYSKNLHFADANNSRKSPPNGTNEHIFRSLQDMLFTNKKK